MTFESINLAWLMKCMAQITIWTFIVSTLITMFGSQYADSRSFCIGVMFFYLVSEYKKVANDI